MSQGRIARSRSGNKARAASMVVVMRMVLQVYGPEPHAGRLT